MCENLSMLFFEALQDRYDGLYPSRVRAVQQAACAAMGNSALLVRCISFQRSSVFQPVDRLTEGWRH